MQNNTVEYSNSEIVIAENIESIIYEIRSKKVILDSDLASLYQVTTKRLNEQVKRNIDRFPADFLFQLTQKEFEHLRSQFATSNHGGRRYLPFAFTEHGVVMAANLLNSKKAIDTSIFVVRTFIKMRELAISYKDLAKKISNIEKKVSGQDKTIASIVIALKRLIEQKSQSESKKREIGFTAKHT